MSDDAWASFLRELNRERFETLTPEQADARRAFARIVRDDDETTAQRREALGGNG